ncbi:Prostaglandin E synthase 3 (Cytosolic) [Blyttiomyces sp. JEL0837]|nr:Prostaglandin E synthase 3 (Cytosolic) [Blyttiomyces sp. JEL0837]
MMSASTQPIVSPEVLWAQREDEIYLTINVSDVESPKIELTKDSLHFVGPSHGKVYEVKLDFFKEVDPEASRQNVTARSLQFVIAKSAPGPYWPRLLKASGKPHFLKTDFARWKDEDEEEEEEDKDKGKAGFDMSQFSGMGGGMPGMPGGMGGGMGGFDMSQLQAMMGGGGMDFGSDDMPEGDSDDDDLPELEDAPKA